MKFSGRWLISENNPIATTGTSAKKYTNTRAPESTGSRCTSGGLLRDGMK